MVDVSGGPLVFEINRIANSSAHRNSTTKAEIHCGPHVITAHQVLRDDRSADFETTYRESRTVTLALSLGDVISYIGPYQDDIKIMLHTTKSTDDMVVESVMYRGYLRDDLPRNIMASASPMLADTESSNRAAMVNISFAINLIVVEYLDNISIGTVVRPAPPFTILKTMMRLYLDQINLSESDCITSLSMYEPSNFEARTQTPIPQNTRLVELPDLLQNKYGGIYSTGLGWYLHKRDLYFWPMYDLVRDQYNLKYLHVIIGPSKHSIMIDRTWLVEGNVVSIIASSPIHVRDDSLGQINLGGDSVRYMDGHKVLDQTGSVKDNVYTADRAASNTELTALRTRQPLNIIRPSKTKVTSNIYRELSRIAKRGVVYLQVTWRFSEHELIIPGMMVKLFYHRGDEVHETTGTVAAIMSVNESSKTGMLDSAMVSTSVLNIIIDRYDPILEDYITTAPEPTSHTTA